MLYVKSMSQASESNEWLINNVLSARSVTLLYGQPSLPVAVLAIEWGILISCGLDWLSFPTKQSKVLYLHAAINVQKQQIPILLQRYGIEKLTAYTRTQAYFEPASILTCRNRYFSKVQRSACELLIIDAHTCIQYAKDICSERLAELLLSFCYDVTYSLGIPVLIVHPVTPVTFNTQAMTLLRNEVSNVICCNTTDYVATLHCEKHIDNIIFSPIPFKLNIMRRSMLYTQT